MIKPRERRIASDRAETINHQNGAPFKKIPKITRLENCVMEIDTTRGVISVSQGGRIKFQVSRIPLTRLALSTITVVAAAEIPSGQSRRGLL
jgi:hypothetical protein